MNASITDLRRRMRDVLDALDRHESVTITYRGREIGTLIPARRPAAPEMSIEDHPAFGMWRDREDMKDVDGWVRGVRRARTRGS
jgi:prevent-host-death family protein